MDRLSGGSHEGLEAVRTKPEQLVYLVVPGRRGLSCQPAQLQSDREGRLSRGMCLEGRGRPGLGWRGVIRRGMVLVVQSSHFHIALFTRENAGKARLARCGSSAHASGKDAPVGASPTGVPSQLPILHRVHGCCSCLHLSSALLIQDPFFAPTL
ncbi:hypothetical protein BCR34DRAFT_329800 [Clohesyomyces aquaticus]|uniref:Uncharacterized protein n=1 Tax=Clohesyomyces aquaticus TaxID=1231657 RepID=A0A1Y1ZLU9_9PLEO|nr:hypothetical protein BCR34DRAFT_329800 [Clohesyomyces aquaticus]